MFLVMSLNLTEEWMMSLVTCKECIQLVQWTMMVILLMLRAACREYSQLWAQLLLKAQQRRRRCHGVFEAELSLVMALSRL